MTLTLIIPSRVSSLFATIEAEFFELDAGGKHTGKASMEAAVPGMITVKALDSDN